jgi:iron complex transport system substrate-binding protein
MTKTDRAVFWKYAAEAMLALLLLLCLCGCGSKKQDTKEIPGLTYVSTDQNEDATQFQILRYRDQKGADGYVCLKFSDGSRYLLIPKDGTVPSELKRMENSKKKGGTDDPVILQQPVSNIYLAATAVMAHFSTLDAMDRLKFTGTRQNDWYIEDARKAMKNGSLLFAGKYSEPDYETLVRYHTALAIESTMILHTPEVKEKLESVGIPVMTDLSSYEKTPFGRAEWIKVYGALLGKKEEAGRFFREEKAKVKKLDTGSKETAKPKVAFFYLDSQGRAVVRKTDDYIPSMITLAGGQYIFKDLKNKNPNSHSGTVTMSLEQFYQDAADADVLIYNAAIEAPLKSIGDLTQKNELFQKFKAVKEKHVWCAEASMYQMSDSTAEIIDGFHAAVTNGNDTEFLKKLA